MRIDPHAVERPSLSLSLPHALNHTSLLFSLILSPLSSPAFPTALPPLLSSPLPVLEYDRKPNGELGQLGEQIRKKRFESYNQVRLQAKGRSFILRAYVTTEHQSCFLAVEKTVKTTEMSQS